MGFIVTNAKPEKIEINLSDTENIVIVCKASNYLTYSPLIGPVIDVWDKLMKVGEESDKDKAEEAGLAKVRILQEMIPDLISFSKEASSIILGWEGLQNEDGTDMEYSEENWLLFFKSLDLTQMTVVIGAFVAVVLKVITPKETIDAVKN